MYNACLDQDFEGNIDISSPSTALILSALKVGEIMKVSAPYEFGPTMWRNLLPWRALADVDVEPSRSYMTGPCCVKEAFWRTVMMDVKLPEDESDELLERGTPLKLQGYFWDLLDMSEKEVESVLGKGQGGDYHGGIVSATRASKYGQKGAGSAYQATVILSMDLLTWK